MLSLLLRYFILKLINILIDINDANNIYSCIFDSNIFIIFGIALTRSLRSRYPWTRLIILDLWIPTSLKSCS